MRSERSVLGNLRGFTAVAVTALLLISCGGGSGGGSGFSVGGSPQQINGTWFGSLQDPLGDLHTYTVTIAGGAVTEIQIDGVVQMDGGQVLTGTITKDSDVLYSLTLSDGTEAAFIVDPAILYAAIVDDEFNFGVVEKDATSLPGYVGSHIDGDWSGVTVETDFTIATEFPSSASCAIAAFPSCTSNITGVNSEVTVVFFPDAVIGSAQWVGTFDENPGNTGAVRIMLSPDRQFAASYACIDETLFPSDCGFSAWVKQ